MPIDVTAITTNIGDFQRTYLYKLDVVNYPVAIDALMPGAKAMIANLDLYCMSSPVPDVKRSPIELKWGGMKGFWAGPIESSLAMDWTFNIDKKWEIYDFFYAWNSLLGDAFNGVALPKPLTLGSVKMSLVDVDKTTVLKAFVVDQLQIFGIDKLDFDKSKSDLQTVKVSARFERLKKVDSGLGNV